MRGLVRRVAFLALWVLCLLAGLVAAVWMLLSILFGSGARAWRVAVGFDQLVNATSGGSEDETISSRAGRQATRNCGWRALCRILDAIDPGHCKKSIGS
jgi:hypothetical protein